MTITGLIRSTMTCLLVGWLGTALAAVDSTAWFAAVNRGDALEVERLLQGTPQFRDSRDEYGQTAVQIAVRLGDMDSVRLLLGKGADLEQRWVLSKGLPMQTVDGAGWMTSSGETLLGLAVRFRHPEIAHLLLDRGANPRAVDNKLGLNLLFTVCDASVARRLIAAGVEVNGQPTKGAFGGAFGPTVPLSRVVSQCQDPEVVRVMLESGANARLLLFAGETALHIAVRRRASVEVVRLLLDHGADAEVRAQFGITPLMLSATDGDDPEVMRLLIERGAKPDAADKLGHSVLEMVSDRRPNAEEKRRILREAIERKTSKAAP